MNTVDKINKLRGKGDISHPEWSFEDNPMQQPKMEPLFALKCKKPLSWDVNYPILSHQN